jgi:hypothetical protein
MITFSGLGKQGRLGNQLFQIASTIGISDAILCGYYFPKWDYEKYFSCPTAFTDSGPNYDTVIKENVFSYDQPLIGQCLKGYASGKSISLSGYFQSEKYWDHIEDYVKRFFTFKPEFIASCRAKLPEQAFSRETIAVCIRRGDYVGHPHYYQIPIKYYITALQKFEDFLDKYNIIFFSDDIEYCKIHFQCLPNAFFSEGNSDIEDLCLISECNNHIIGNSTFHWWGAYLAKSNVVIRPDVYFAGESLSKSTKDFWPEDWEVHSVNEYISLPNTSFITVYREDSIDRKENLELLDRQVQQFSCNEFIVMVSAKDKPFHRTKLINDAVRSHGSMIFVSIDVDMVIAPMQILLAVMMIASGSAEFVYPYDGRFIKLNRYSWYRKILKTLDIGSVSRAPLAASDKMSVGGCVVLFKPAFADAGMENENFVSFGPEDKERFFRFIKLGFRVERVKGAIYHMNHYRGSNSGAGNPDYLNNVAEYKKEKMMTSAELREYVKTWSW